MKTLVQYNPIFQFLEITTADSWVCSLVEWNFMISFVAMWMVERTGDGGE